MALETMAGAAVALVVGGLVSLELARQSDMWLVYVKIICFFFGNYESICDKSHSKLWQRKN